MNRSIFFQTALNVTFAALILVSSTAEADESLHSRATDVGISNYTDQQNLRHKKEGFRLPMWNNEDCFVLLDEFPVIKIYLRDDQQCHYLPSVLRWTRFPLPVQAIYNGMMFDGAHEYQEQCRFTFYYEPGVFVAQNQQTKEMLDADNVLNLFGFSPANTDSVDIFQSSFVSVEDKGVLELTLGKNWNEYDADVQKCLKVYVCLWLDSFKAADECMKMHSPTDDEKSCAADWRRCIRKTLFKDDFAQTVDPCKDHSDGTGTDDTIPTPTPTPSPVVAVAIADFCVGHIPDTCAGGHPAPAGCFWKQPSRCNSILGKACQITICAFADKLTGADEGDKSKVCVKYNDFKIVDKAGTAIPLFDCTAGTTDQPVIDARGEITANKAAFWTKICEKKADDTWKYRTCIKNMIKCWDKLGDHGTPYLDQFDDKGIDLDVFRAEILIEIQQ